MWLSGSTSRTGHNCGVQCCKVKGIEELDAQEQAVCVSDRSCLRSLKMLSLLDPVCLWRSCNMHQHANLIFYCWIVGTLAIPDMLHQSTLHVWSCMTILLNVLHLVRIMWTSSSHCSVTSSNFGGCLLSQNMTRCNDKRSSLLFDTV